jgi:peptidoglycan hydrolase-like amidase
MRCCALVFALFLPVSAVAAQSAPDVRIGVLGLFHPQQVVLEPASSQAVVVSPAGAAPFVLNGEAGHRTLTFRVDRDHVLAGNVSALSWTATARDTTSTSFRLSIPGRIRRVYQGRLTILARSGELVLVVAMDRETAVRSIVAAESAPNTPMEALKAQAVVSRSFLVAGPRHSGFDFCDTTHCQFLRSPPPAGSPVARAVAATRGLVLFWHGKPLAALYSSRCGGATRSLQQVGMDPGDGYPYYSVRCPYCLRHPLRWQSRIEANAPSPTPGNERQRIAEDRQWGWSAVPGSQFTVDRDHDQWLIEGHSAGHGVGLCQYGALGMASSGAAFREILRHYYPNTEIVTLSQSDPNADR